MIEVFDFEQNSDEWARARMGLPTASRFGDILAKGQGIVRRKYLYQLAGEILTGEPAETFNNRHTERGHEMETEAREMYALLTDATPVQVGFIRNGNKGCSPDSLLGDDGVLEIKSKLPALTVECLLRDEFPPEHVAQCQGALWVAERDWVDIAVYWPGLPMFIKRAGRDEKYIAKLADEVARFNDELAHVVERLRAYGNPLTYQRNQFRAAVAAEEERA